MSRKNIIESVVRRLIVEAKTSGYVVKSIFDTEEIIKNENFTISQLVKLATGTDFARIDFVKAGVLEDAKFAVFMVYENKPSEMISDHTDTVEADKICRKVHDYFVDKGQ